MNVVESDSSEQIGFFGRFADRVRRIVQVDDAQSNPSVKKPISRVDLEDLVRMNHDDKFAQADELLKSEKLERDSMAMIRGALYKK